MNVYRTTMLTQVLMQFVIRMIVLTEQHASKCEWDDVRRFPIDGCIFTKHLWRHTQSPKQNGSMCHSSVKLITSLCSPSEYFGRLNMELRVLFEALFKDVSTRFGLWTDENSFKIAHATRCSGFRNLRLGTIQFIKDFRTSSRTLCMVGLWFSDAISCSLVWFSDVLAGHITISFLIIEMIQINS